MKKYKLFPAVLIILAFSVFSCQRNEETSKEEMRTDRVLSADDQAKLSPQDVLIDLNIVQVELHFFPIHQGSHHASDETRFVDAQHQFAVAFGHLLPVQPQLRHQKVCAVFKRHSPARATAKSTSMPLPVSFSNASRKKWPRPWSK